MLLTRLKNMLWGTFYVIAGICLSILMLEIILSVNPRAGLRGMALRLPVDEPLQVREYDVHYSDGDIFYWYPHMVKRLSLAEDGLESSVRFVTDEWGFHNDPPLPEKVDVVVLGSSYSQGAQVAQSWSEKVARKGSIFVFNMAQPGATMDIRLLYLKKLGLVYDPDYLIIEVLPGLDVVENSERVGFLIADLPAVVIRNIYRSFFSDALINEDIMPIFPVAVDISGEKFNLTCCMFHEEIFSLDLQALASSINWLSYQRHLDELIYYAQNAGVEVILLYAPTKPEVYFPLISDVDVVKPIVNQMGVLQLGDDNKLIENTEKQLSISEMQSNIPAGRELIIAYARSKNIILVDPTEAMREAVRHGKMPFMAYDSHWQEYGHEIIADMILESMANGSSE